MWPVRDRQDDSVASNYPANIWKSGQTTSYYAGDDGALQKGVAWPNPRFIDHGNGTVTDNLTGLMWTKDANLLNGAATWQQVLDYVAAMNTGSGTFGYTDWRQPNVNELKSLIDYGEYMPALVQGHPFTNVQLEGYWSSTTVANSTSAWLPAMHTGHVSSHDKSDKVFYGWPVRGGEVTTTTSINRSATPVPDTGQTKCYNNTQEIACPQPGEPFYGQDAQHGPNLQSFTDLGNGIVRDNVTGLEWQQATAPGTYTWQQALDYVAGMNSGSGTHGFTDWRLPTIKELSTLVDSSIPIPARP